MNKFAEIERLTFYLKRDGLECAKKSAKQLIMIYLLTIRAYKKKPSGRKHPYRLKYVEAAFSARYILRHKLLENIHVDLS